MTVQPVSTKPGLRVATVSDPREDRRPQAAAAVASPAGSFLPRARRSTSRSPAAARPAAPHERRHPPARLDPGEAPAHPQHQLIEFLLPAIQVYAEASGHHTVFCCPHNFGSSGDGHITSTVLAHVITNCRWRVKPTSCADTIESFCN